MTEAIYVHHPEKVHFPLPMAEKLHPKPLPSVSCQTDVNKTTKYGY